MQSAALVPVHVPPTVSAAAPRSSLRPLRERTVPVPQTARRSRDESETERALIAGMLEGDASAWRRFSADYSGLVIGCIRRVLARFSRVTCEHDVDEIYARFCCDLLARDKHKLRAFDPERGNRLSTWIGMLASNATYDYLRRVRRDRVCEPMPESDRFSSDLASPFEEALRKEQAHIAATILDELSERDRTFVQLYFGEGLDVGEIATEMGISEKTVYTKKHKITARLEKLLRNLRAA